MKTLLVLAVCGCVNVTTTAVTTGDRVIGPETSTRPMLAVRSEVADGMVVVGASWSAECRREVVDPVTATRRSKIALLGTSNGDRYGYALLGLYVLPPMWAIAVVSLGVAVASAPDDKTQVTQQVAGVFRRPCPRPAARVLVHVRLASGRVIDGITDEQGTFAYAFAAGESGEGLTVTNDPVPEP